MTLGYFYVSAAVMKLKGLSLREKLLLALVISFNEKGLKVGNEELADLLNVRMDRISTLLVGLERKGYIEIENRQSRYRHIYFRPKSKVGAELLLTKTKSKEALLMTLVGSTYDESHNITKELHKRRAHKNEKPVCDTDTGFDKFWAAYPKKIAEKDARKSWAKLKPSPELVETILGAIERQKMTEGWMKKNGQYIPKAENWLDGERWKDEIGGNGELVCHDATEEEADALLKEVGCGG